MPILIPIRSGSVKTVIPETPGIHPVVPALPLPEPPRREYGNDDQRASYVCPAGYFGNPGFGFVKGFTLYRYSKEEANAAALLEAQANAQAASQCVLGAIPETIFLVVSSGQTLEVTALYHSYETWFVGSTNIAYVYIHFYGGTWQGVYHNYNFTNKYHQENIYKKGVNNINNVFGDYTGDTLGDIFSISATNPNP